MHSRYERRVSGPKSSPYCGQVAIFTESKKFCSSPLVQNVMNDIWQGHVVFSATSTHALVQDNYKSREIEFYDHRNAPFLNHYRLRVPKYRSIVDSANVVALLILFVLCLASESGFILMASCTSLQLSMQLNILNGSLWPRYASLVSLCPHLA
jgi:hypothetical protein